MDLTAFAAAVGAEDPVTIAGSASRGGPVAGVRTVRAPAGIERIEPDEMTMSCGAATPIAEIQAALGEFGQRLAVPDGGTIGGALSDGRSGVRALGDGPLRDVLLQAHYISAAGRLVRAGGPTVKNVSGFDLCRVLVGAQGALGFLGHVTLRTRPIAPGAGWFRRPATEQAAMAGVLGALYRPVSVLWDGSEVWVLLEGRAGDIDAQRRAAGLVETDGPPALPPHRWATPPSRAIDDTRPPGTVVEVGVGVEHRHEPAPAPAVSDAVRRLNQAVKDRFDPTGRLNPGRGLGASPAIATVSRA